MCTEEPSVYRKNTLVWARLSGFSRYVLSDCGDLLREGVGRPRRIRGVIDADGYIRYAMTDDAGKRRYMHAHVLVATAFHGARPTRRHEVAHNNGSRLCNCAWNLRWDTRKGNDSDRIGHSTDPKGIRNGRATICDDDVRYIRERYRYLKLHRLPVGELDKRFGLSRSQIIRIARREAWSHVED